MNAAAQDPLIKPNRPKLRYSLGPARSLFCSPCSLWNVAKFIVCGEKVADSCYVDESDYELGLPNPFPDPKDVAADSYVYREPSPHQTPHSARALSF